MKYCWAHAKELSCTEPQKKVGKSFWVSITRTGSALPNLPSLPRLLWGMVETPRPLHSIHLTTPPVLKLENYSPLCNFPLLQDEPLLLVISTYSFFPPFRTILSVIMSPFHLFFCLTNISNSLFFSYAHLFCLYAYSHHSALEHFQPGHIFLEFLLTLPGWELRLREGMGILG